MQTAAQPIKTRTVEPATERGTASQRPTETRYGWCPYGDINLVNADGTPYLYVQPHEIEENGVTIPNPYHRILPKGQLIPFPTFNALEQMPSPDQRDSTGRALLIQSARTVTALDAAVSVLRAYSSWGFKVLDSLQGLDQATAFRIFQVVHPLGYSLGDLVNELAFGAQERIDSHIVLTFPDAPGYEVQPLLDSERPIAEQLASEMLAGAEIALTLANETLDGTATSMTTRFAGGQGKTGPDPLDRRLTGELGRELPKLVNDKPDTTALENKLDFLVGREQSRADKEEIERLQKEIAVLKGETINENTMKEPLPPVRVELTAENQHQYPELPPFKVGDTVTLDGKPVTVTGKPFGRYTVLHEDGTSETVDRSELI